ncbi:AMP-binding protein [Streptomyces sp. H34-S4]|uniref:AMP-binding protein n=1 Tax=Streptomyces sp. H34-S4 TaxID=2996463 RepID=UPI002271B67F|nr:AMP-binding protein [Streptomyces sp. H34-S4]MCY0933016.1 AMP-binding protein [Streptomyces sp. H34-S4]
MLTPHHPSPGIAAPQQTLLARHLASYGDRPAILGPDGDLSYRELAERVAETADRLGTDHRRLVLLAGANTVDALVVYLAALAAGHPVLLVPGDNDDAVRSLTAAYDPDTVARPDAAGRWVIDERNPVSAHELHPELALLLSTSGSTGSPKLVRLSYDNLQANAESIADYLGIREDDRAATTLPLHYCYGLSVVNSHLLRGAALILTGLSVSDDAFWTLFRDRRGTSIAGVPYTFDLLDRVGFTEMDLPHLRYITQAGGRLAPERVTEYAGLGRRRGWDLYVMYGQTEATARMAYLPPGLAATHPQAIGVPVPGGAFRLHPHPDWPGPDTGELVYAGPNVMLGYANHPSDLGLGRTTDELHTGDIARRTADGLYEIVGRSSGFAKVLGLRIDPQQTESLLARHGFTAYCTGADGALVLAVAGHAGTDPVEVRRIVTAACGLPARAVHVHVLPELPRLATGKPDYQAVRALGCLPAEIPARSTGRTDLRCLYAEILDRGDVTEDSSFISLGGDSLSYVEMSIALEEALGHLPDDWHTLPIRELVDARTELDPSPGPRAERRRRRRLETGIALRAAAIVFVVGSHIPDVFYIKGGAHLLLMVAGFNLARFHLTPSAERRDRVRNLGRGIGRVALPSMVWIGLVMLVNDDYDLANLFLLNSILGPHGDTPRMQFWFVETLVYLLIALVALLALRSVDRAERRFPFALPMAAVAAGLTTRYDVFGLTDRFHVPEAATLFWLFALGWAAAKSSTVRQRWLVTAVATATVAGFFPGLQPFREALVIAGFALLVWAPSLPSRGWVNRAAGILAGSSLYIYLTHWQIYPHFQGSYGWLALFTSLALGIGYAEVATRVARKLPALLRHARGVHTSTRAAEVS